MSLKTVEMPPGRNQLETRLFGQVFLNLPPGDIKDN